MATARPTGSVGPAGIVINHAKPVLVSEEQLGEGHGGTLASCTSLKVTVAGALRLRLRALLTIRTFRDC